MYLFKLPWFLQLNLYFKTLFAENCVGKMFILTPAPAPFVKARGMCLAMGGDIVQEVIGKSGVKFHRY